MFDRLESHCLVPLATIATRQVQKIMMNVGLVLLEASAIKDLHTQNLVTQVINVLQNHLKNMPVLQVNTVPLGVKNLLTVHQDSTAQLTEHTGT